jgi:TolB protein
MRLSAVIALALAMAALPVMGEEPASAAAAAREISSASWGKARVRLGEWTGSTGATARDILVKDLETAGDYEFTSDPGVPVINGESSGGRLHGELLGADGKLLFAENYDSLDLKTNVHTFADEVASAIFGKPGVATTQIAFVSDVSGRKEIYLCDSDGTNVRQVTHDAALCVSPSLRSDAVLLAFTSYVTGYPDLYLIDLRSGNRRRVINAPGTNSGAAFSPEGERLAMTMSFAGNPEIYVTNPGGNGGRRLTRNDFIDSSPAWSPDGKRIVYCSNATGKPQLCIMDAEGSDAPERLETGYGYCTEPSWSPDAVRIAFTVRTGTTLSVAVFNLATGKSHLLGEGEDPCWGADGRHLVYSSGDALVIRNVNAGIQRRILTNFGRVTEPSWSR